jgi:hypothetical protein
MTSLRELAAGYPESYRNWLARLSDDEHRKILQSQVDELDGNFRPDPNTLIWLLEQAGIKVH